MKQKTDAYFTVEAVLVFPIVFAVVLFVIYLWFYQYDRCLLEQDMGMLALRGTAIQMSDNEERIRAVKKYADSLYKKKYIAWDEEKTSILIEKGKLQVRGKGNVCFPFRGWNFWGEDNIWETEAVYKNTVLSPVSFIRNYHKLMGGK